MQGCLRFVMLRTIQFNHQMCGGTIKIYDVFSNNSLLEDSYRVFTQKKTPKLSLVWYSHDVPSQSAVPTALPKGEPRSSLSMIESILSHNCGKHNNRPGGGSTGTVILRTSGTYSFFSSNNLRCCFKMIFIYCERDLSSNSARSFNLDKTSLSIVILIFSFKGFIKSPLKYYRIKHLNILTNRIK